MLKSCLQSTIACRIDINVDCIEPGPDEGRRQFSHQIDLNPNAAVFCTVYESAQEDERDRAQLVLDYLQSKPIDVCENMGKTRRGWRDTRTSEALPTPTIVPVEVIINDVYAT